MAKRRYDAEEIRNPLPELCKVMGLTTKTAARLAGVPFSAARQAMAAKPCGAIEAYIRIANAIGAQYRMRRADPIRVWLDVSRLDAMYLDNDFRRRQDLHAIPTSRYRLRRLIVRMRARHKKSYSAIVDFMNRNQICTVEGTPTWRRGNVSKQMDNRRKRFADDDEPVKPNAASLERWREYLIDKLLAEASGADPFFQVRYGIKRRLDGDHLILGTTNVITEKPRAWFLERLAGIPWLAGSWGLILPFAISPEASPSETTGKPPGTVSSEPHLQSEQPADGCIPTLDR